MRQLISSILLLFSVLYSSSLSALNSPDLRCLKVNSDGSVLLTWLTPTDMNLFQRYEIYYSYDNSTFTLAASLNSPVTTYLHAIDANLNPTVYYYAEAVSTTGSRFRSRTLATIAFYLSNPGFGRAQLNWIHPTDPLLPSYSSLYQVEMKSYIDADFSVRASVSSNQLAYTDEIGICSGSIDYRISIEDVSAGCVNVSRVQDDVFSNMIAPEEPSLDSVSVDFASGITHLGWTPSGSSDVFAYIIYFDNDIDGWLPVDTVFGYNNTSWADAVNMPGAGSGQYRIAALDSCMNSSPMTDFQQVMILSGTLNDCEETVTLRWNSYQNMPEDVLGYTIYYSLNGAPLQFAATSSTTTYTFRDVLAESNYIFVVQAINGSGVITASSRAFELNSGEAPPEYQLYFRYASVINNQDIELRIFTSGDTLPFSTLNLYRSNSPDVGFSLLTTLPYNGTTDYQFVDQTVDVSNEIYYYYAEILNTCNSSSKISNTVQNFLLKGETSGERINLIKWSTPIGWEQGVDYFAVERKTQIDPDFEEIGVRYPSSANSYEDLVEELFNTGSDFSYQVIAVETINSYGFKDRSVSNVVVLKQLPVTYIANAFAPGWDHSKSFKPVNSFVDVRNYYFAIYSRTGQVIFLTKDPYEAWDGTLNGEPVQMDVYTYLLKYSLPDGTPYERCGSITLVR